MSNDPELLRLAADITAAHVSNNAVSMDALPGLVRSIYDALSMAGVEVEEAERRQPAVPIKKSVFPDYIVCLEDGKKLKMLKRHLQSAYGLTPDEYRKRWGLPAEYPMTAPNYASRRSALAKENGLGRSATARGQPVTPAVQRIPEGRRGRKAQPSV